MNTFKRNNITFFGYFIISFFAFGQMGLGPVSPYISYELRINKAQSGLYVTMFAAGMMISGFLTTFLRHHIARKIRFIIGFIGLVVSLFFFVLVKTYILSLISIFFLGGLSTIILTAGQAILSDNHGPRRDTALTEANIYAATTAIICPLLLGLAVKNGLNWRIGFIGPVVIVSIIFIYYITILYRDPGHYRQGSSDNPKLSVSYLLYFYCNHYCCISIFLDRD